MKECNLQNTLDEQCGRSVTRNVASAGANVSGGILIGAALAFIPVTGGLSIALVAGGSLLWGLFGSEVYNGFGEIIEGAIYD